MPDAKCNHDIRLITGEERQLAIDDFVRMMTAEGRWSEDEIRQVAEDSAFVHGRCNRCNEFLLSRTEGQN